MQINKCWSYATGGSSPIKKKKALCRHRPELFIWASWGVTSAVTSSDRWSEDEEGLTCLTFFLFYLRAAREKDGGWVSATSQSECAPTEKLTQGRRAEATQRENSLGVVHLLGSVVWVELAGTCVRDWAWSVGKGQGLQVLIIVHSPGAHRRSELLPGHFPTFSMWRLSSFSSVKLWSGLMYVLCSLAVLALHGLLRSWSRRDPVQEEAGKRRREGGRGRRRRGGGGEGGCAAHVPDSRESVQVSWNRSGHTFISFVLWGHC